MLQPRKQFRSKRRSIKLLEAGMPRMDAMKAVARERGLSKREVYQKLNER